MMIDLRPATERLAAMLAGLDDDQLAAPTPCPAMSLGDLVDHIGSLTVAFAAVARKDLDRTGAPPTPSRTNLADDWRGTISADLAQLAEAWRRPDAWHGWTRAGSIDLPGDVAGVVALDELVVHGWDVAVASGQQYRAEPDEVAALIEFVASFDAPRDGNLFGPVVLVPDDAEPFARLLGMTGRDPGWHAVG